MTAVILCLGFFVSAQKIEFGGGGGPTFYKGDIQPRFQLFNPSIAGNAFFRYNHNRVLSSKINLSYGHVKGDDKRSGDPFQKDRDFGFSHNVLDAYLQTEYNFLNFRTHTGRYEYDWTPYFFAGLGYALTTGSKFYAGSQDIPVNQNFGGIIVPFGIGVKQILGPRLNVSAEFITKVFFSGKTAANFDGLNGVTGENIYYTGPDEQYLIPNTQQRDKYYQFSVTLSYLIYSVKCNTPGKNNSFF